MHMKYKCNVSSHCSTESSDSMGGQGASQGMEDKLCSAMNPNRAEMPGNKRKGSYDQVHHQHVYNAHYTCVRVCTCTLYMWVHFTYTVSRVFIRRVHVYIYIYIYIHVLSWVSLLEGGDSTQHAVCYMYIYTCTCTLECVLAVLYIFSVYTCTK